MKKRLVNSYFILMRRPCNLVYYEQQRNGQRASDTHAPTTHLPYYTSPSLPHTVQNARVDRRYSFDAYASRMCIDVALHGTGYWRIATHVLRVYWPPRRHTSCQACPSLRTGSGDTRRVIEFVCLACPRVSVCVVGRAVDRPVRPSRRLGVAQRAWRPTHM